MEIENTKIEGDWRENHEFDSPDNISSRENMVLLIEYSKSVVF